MESEQDYINKVVAALAKVPRKELLIIELANRFTKNGELDCEGLAHAQPEVNLATAEAKMYGSHTLVAVDGLKKVEAIPADD